MQLETTSSWQTESPRKEELELLRVINDLRLDGKLMRQAISAGDWADLMKSDRLKREAARMLQRGGVSGRGAEKHLAEDSK